ncbi:hypothetical protein WJX81_003138 [Elliptochloris bilobata]|uniref:Starch synthase, chloroplastic/amyloplastic n=1 Tax=Elliptochloris bilobata TaxID=381761 RepID=A0AAW1SES8_9CHLO
MFGGTGAYVPPAGAGADMTLRLKEPAHVMDLGLVPHRGLAVLDSGNAGCTLITAPFAARLGLVDASGWPRQAHVRTMSVHGVVAGAMEKIPQMTLTYEIKGKKMHITAGVTKARLGCDLLICHKEIAEFISAGFKFDPQHRTGAWQICCSADESSADADGNLQLLHDSLKKQVEERKRLHQELMEKLKHQGFGDGSQAPPAQLSFPPPPQPAQPAYEPEPPPSQHEPEPLAGPNVMNVVMVGAECAPWSKTGGLGDVMGALPKALARRGHRTMVVAPRYSNYAEGWETGVRVSMRVMSTNVEVGYFHGYIDGVDYVFVDHPCYHGRQDNIYGGDRHEILFRCALLSKAALEAPWHVPCGGVPYGDSNLAFIANDWHTALLPLYLQAHYRDYGKMTYARSVFVVHNIAHQGRGPMAELAPLEVPSAYSHFFRLDDPIGGMHMNVMKAGLMAAHRVVAVSHGYAWECQTAEGGWGLDSVLREGAWKLRGIVNGIDTREWSPEADVHLRSNGYANYSAASLRDGKARCKAALQRELGLPERPDAPLLGFIGRLDYQKGVDLIRDNFQWIMDEGCQLVLLGTGRADLENSLREMESSRHEQCRGWVGFNVGMAHRITAGCDILLMPSRFEPCGLNQLYAMAYGTVPVVHAVGGLRDTVTPFDPHSNSGTGWTFDWADSGAFRGALGNALYTYRDYRREFEGVQQRGMAQDLSWDHAAELYEEVLVAAKYQW